LEDDNVVQSIWDKVRCYLGICWGTHWELGNFVGTH